MSLRDVDGVFAARGQHSTAGITPKEPPASAPSHRPPMPLGNEPGAREAARPRRPYPASTKRTSNIFGHHLPVM